MLLSLVNPIILLLITAVCGVLLCSASSWVETSAPQESWVAVASSSDGQFLVAAPLYGYIYTSSNG